MYISQNVRQSWYGNVLGDNEHDDDQDAIKVNKILFGTLIFVFCFFF